MGDLVETDLTGNEVGPAPLSPRAHRFLSRLSLAVGASLLVEGLLVLVAWASDVDALKSPLPGHGTMKANTAACIALLGASLMIHGRAHNARVFRVVARVVTYTAGFIAALTLIQDATGLSFGIDEALFRDRATTGRTGAPGRMAIPTAFSIVMLSTATALSGSSSRRRRLTSDACAAAALATGLLGIAGYLYGAPTLYSIAARFTSMSLHTAITILLGALGVLAIDPNRAVVRAIAAGSVGGRLARRLVPFAIVVPLALGWVRLLGQQHGLYETEIGVSAFAVSNVVVFVSAILASAASVHRTSLERERAEASELRQARRLRQVLDSLREGVVVVDARGRLVDSNPMAEQIVGKGITDVPKERWSENYGVFDLDGKTPYPAEELPLARAVRGETVAETELIIRHAGRPEGIVVSTSAMPMHAADGSLIGALSVFVDITAKLQAARDRERIQARLQQAERLESVGQLAGGVAHDFNNLLAAISNYAQLLGDEMRDVSLDRLEADRAQILDDVDQIMNATKRASDLTQRLLTFSRRAPINPEVVDLNAVVTDMEKLLRRTIGEHVELSTVCDPDLWRVRSDPTQLEQVIMNLAVNARDAITAGGMLRISTSNVVIGEHDTHTELRPGDYVCLTVADTGRGMTSDVASHVFEPFFTTKPPGEGTGLGLATVYGVATQTGGTVHLYSEPGIGTTFKVYLPRTFEDDAGARPIAALAAPRGNGESILLVEDEESVRLSTERLLQRAGYEVVVVGLPGVAIDVATHMTRLDLLLTDVVMPHLSGLELAQRIHEIHPGAKLVFMSGYSHETIAQRGLSQSGLTLIEKPFTEATLLHAVRSAIDGR